MVNGLRITEMEIYHYYCYNEAVESVLSLWLLPCMWYEYVG